MKIEFRSTPSFEKEFSKLGHRDKVEIAARIHYICSLYQEDRRAFFNHVGRPIVPKLSSGLNSTLYVMRVKSEVRVFFVYDEDPLFETLSFLLLHVFRKREAVNRVEYLKAASAFYGAREKPINEYKLWLSQKV